MNQRAGYTRVSTYDQHLDLKRDALMQVGNSVICVEVVSGKNALVQSLASVADLEQF